jgi:hypothetical protein
MPQQTHPQHIQKESDYIKHLCTGEGSTDGQKTISKGLQVVKKTGEVKREEGSDKAEG